ncbi:hypothetical protein ACFWUQ_06405 [Streptomyces sp. NPDC058662]|uniref:hypothetical protein n=1 Tax=Streptomyces sp. NPDC058662 TaxID=3346583 RepID=UPI00365A62F2
MPSVRRRTLPLRPAAAVAAALCAALLCGGCADRQPAAAPGTSIEEIATAIGCTAEVMVEADELRQGGCATAEGPYRMVTFAADRGLRSWLTEAKTYGGSYLVGDRWVVTNASPETLGALRDRLGGTLDTGSTHGGPPGHSGAGH